MPAHALATPCEHSLSLPQLMKALVLHLWCRELSLSGWQTLGPPSLRSREAHMHQLWEPVGNCNTCTVQAVWLFHEAAACRPVT